METTTQYDTVKNTINLEALVQKFSLQDVNQLKALFQEKKTIVLGNDDSIYCPNIFALRRLLYAFYEKLELPNPKIILCASILNGSGYGACNTEDLLKAFTEEKNKLKYINYKLFFSNFCEPGHKSQTELFDSVEKFNIESLSKVVFTTLQGEIIENDRRQKKYTSGLEDIIKLLIPNDQYQDIYSYNGYPADVIDIINKSDKFCDIEKVDLLISGPNVGRNDRESYSISGTCNIGNIALFRGEKFKDGIKIAISEGLNSYCKNTSYVNDYLGVIISAVNTDKEYPSFIEKVLFNYNISAALDNTIKTGIRNDFLIPKKKPSIKKPKETESIIMRDQCTSEFYHEQNQSLVKNYIEDNIEKLNALLEITNISTEHSEHSETNHEPASNNFTMEGVGKDMNQQILEC
jgi:5'/3'-nucleotidase SurE